MTHKTRVWVNVGLTAGLLLASVSPAGATERAAGNGDGMDTHLFRPSIDSKGFISTDGSDILGSGDISFGLILDYGKNLLRTANEDPARSANNAECKNDTCVVAGGGTGVPALVEDSFQGTFAFNYGLANLAVVGVTLPVLLMTGDEAYQIGPNNNIYNASELGVETFGSLALHAKFRLTRVQETLGVALVGQVGVPVSDAPKELGADPGFWYWPRVVVENRFGSAGRFRMGVNAGYRGHTGENPSFENDPRTGRPQLEEGIFEPGNLATFGFGMSLRALDALDIVAETYGSYVVDGRGGTDHKLSQEIIGGIKLFIEKNSYLTMAAGSRAFSKGFEAADLRLVLGFVYEPSIGDRDGDGYMDDEDECPDDPEDFDDFEDGDGCPDPDNDKDGILDVDDRCVNIPEDKDGDHDEDGCPGARKATDRDGDGIVDSKDKCPDEPEDKDGFEDEDGCPDPDNDKDGILDVDDQCPDDPEDKDGFEDEDGCPDPDNDKDQIPDVKDKCPNDPETYNGLDDEDGCPDKGKVVIEGDDIVVLEKVQFETGSAKILPESEPIIDAVAAVLRGHPEFLVVEVGGHADERASDGYNLNLTRSRAAAVMAALKKKSVADSRLVSQGYGEYCPLDDQSNPEAWEKNRRVEFKIVKTDDGMTDVPRGCTRALERGVRPPPVQ